MKCIIDEDKINRTLRRISHEIIERNNNLSEVVFIGVKKDGCPVAKIIHENICNFENIELPIYELDITGYRDDIEVEKFEKLNVDLTDKVVIIVDDVLYTGRTIRASMDAVIDLGRPKNIQFAVLVDRGHREFPVRADYVGKNLPTGKSENVIVDLVNAPGVYLTEK